MKGKVIYIGKPEAVEEVIKSRCSGSVTGAEAAENGMEGREFKKASPVGEGYDVHHDGEQKGAGFVKCFLEKSKNFVQYYNEKMGELNDESSRKPAKSRAGVSE